eukprot:g35276.t1
MTQLAGYHRSQSEGSLGCNSVSRTLHRSLQITGVAVFYRVFSDHYERSASSMNMTVMVTDDMIDVQPRCRCSQKRQLDSTRHLRPIKYQIMYAAFELLQIAQALFWDPE